MLDLKIVYIILSYLMILVSLLLFILCKRFNTKIVRFSIGFYLLQTISLILIIHNNSLWGIFSIVLPNILIIFSYLYSVKAYWVFFYIRRSSFNNYFFVIIYSFVYVYYTYFHTNLTGQQVATSFAAVFFHSQTFLIYVIKKSNNMQIKVVGVGTLIMLIIAIVKLLSSAVNIHVEDIYLVSNTYRWLITIQYGFYILFGFLTFIVLRSFKGEAAHVS